MELAELVVGGVSLAIAFNDCVALFDGIDSGRNCSKKYQLAALEVALLARRLVAWEQSYKKASPPANPEDGHLAENALSGIKQCLEDVASTSERYDTRTESAPTDDDAVLTERVKLLTVNKPCVGSKIMWALHDRNKLCKTTATIARYLDSLERLSWALVKPLHEDVNISQALQMAQPTANNRPEAPPQSFAESASAADPEFGKAVQTAVHTYINIKVGTDARVGNGDYFAKGYTGPVSTASYQYENMDISERARVLNGSNYSGPSVYDA